jgi:hypothetical protein
MKTDYKKLRLIFEKWIIVQFGFENKPTDIKNHLVEKDSSGAYVDEDINAMFIAFCAGSQSRDWI